MAVLLGVLGLACAAYGVAMAVLYPAGGFFAVWLVIAALLLAVSLAIKTGAWARLAAAARYGIAGAALACVVAVGATCCVIFGTAASAPPAGADYVIVLGAGLQADGSPRAALRYRLDAALDYLEANPSSTCIVSGGQGADEPRTEASAMAEYLEARGLDPERVVLEERSTSTAQNLEYSRALMDSPADSAVVVTNNFHLFRALRIAARAGLANVHGLAAKLDAIYLPQATLRECVAVAKDTLVGNL